MSDSTYLRMAMKYLRGSAGRTGMAAAASALLLAGALPAVAPACPRCSFASPVAPAEASVLFEDSPMADLMIEAETWEQFGERQANPLKASRALALGERRAKAIQKRAAFEKAGGFKSLKTTPAEFAAIPNDQFAEAIATATQSDLYALWSWNSDVEQVVAPHRMILVTTLLQTEAAGTIDAYNYGRSSNLLYYLQIAFYHEFYQQSLTYTAQQKATARNAVVAIGNDPWILDDDGYAIYLRDQWATTIDSVDGQLGALGVIRELFVRYNSNPALAEQYYERGTIYSLLYGLSRQIGNNSAQGQNSPWYNAVPTSLVNAIGALANNQNYKPQEEYLVNNALWVLGGMSALAPAQKNAAHGHVATAFDSYPHDSYPWVWSIRVLKDFYGSKKPGNVSINLPVLINELKGIVFPDSYSFENNALVFRSSIDEDKVKLLYDAIQEVEAQFFRFTRNVNPVPNDPNSDLDLYIYADPDQYDTYQPLLFGTATNNGGIYLEENGAFYTYDRTVYDSIYTLEELTRHEYVHYLDGRYNVTGLFGQQGTHYTGVQDFLWYVEGLAECIAGGTRLNGIKPRRSLVAQIANDGANGRMSVGEIINSDYNTGFKFYRYAGTFMLYLVNERPDILNQIITNVRGSNSATVQNYFEQLTLNSQLNTAYQAYLDTLVDAYNNETPQFFAEDFPTGRTLGVTGNNQQALFNKLKSGVTTTNPQITTNSNRFVFSDNFTFTVIGTPVTYPASHRSVLNQFLNNRLTALQGQEDNFRNAVAYYGNVQTNGATITGKYYIEGTYSATDTYTLATFEWEPLPDMQPNGVAFPVQLTAISDVGKKFTGYTGTPALSAWSGFDVLQLGERYLNYTSYWPLNTNANDSRTQVIIPKDWIGGPSPISALSLDIEIPPLPMKDFTIRLRHTPLEAFPDDGTAQWETTGWTTVYAEDLTITITTTGLYKFAFTTPFHYNGVDNLMVDFSFNNSSYSDRGYVFSNWYPGEYRVMHGSGYSAADDNPLTWTGNQTNPDISDNMPIMVLEGGPSVPITHSNVAFQNGVWTGTVTVPDKARSVRLFAEDGGKVLAPSEYFDVDGFSLTVTTSGGNGTVLVSPQQAAYAPGTQVGILANNGSGANGMFTYWSGDVPGGVSQANPLAITMTQNRSIVAHFGEPLPTPVEPTPTPVPSTKTFTFDTGHEGWTYIANIPGYTSPAEEQMAGHIAMRTTDNAANIGLYQSPIFELAHPGGVPQHGLYRVTLAVRSDAVDPAVVPTFRGRSWTSDHQRTDELNVTSHGDGSYSPTGSVKDFRWYFSAPGSFTDFRLGLDVINLNPGDLAQCLLALDQATIEALGGTTNLGASTPVAMIPFAGGDTQGFTPRDAAPSLAVAQFASSSAGLSIQGVTDNPQNAPDVVFGYWGKETNIPVETGKLYRVRWKVSSDATVAAQVPAIRLRVNETSLKYSQLVQIESMGDASLVATSGAGKEYDLWLAPPAEVNGSEFILSFDYLFSKATGDDPTRKLTLEYVSLVTYPLPN